MTGKEKQNALPMLDCALLATPEGAEKMLSALKDSGMFWLTGHGIDTEAAFAQSRRFFALPQAEKDALSVYLSDRWQGYEAPNNKDSKEAFIMGPEIPADDPLASLPYHGPNRWPEIEGWKDFQTAFFSQCLALTKRINAALAVSFGLDAGYFEPMSRHPMAALRLLRYAPCSKIPGIAPHTDWGAFSLLFQHGEPGLEVMENNVWHPLPARGDAILVMAGGIARRWSNDLVKAPLHRVINAQKRERFSIAFFLDMDHDAVIAPLPGTGKARYAPLRVADYIDEMHKKDYA